MAVRTQPTLSPGMSVRIAEAASLSPSSFCKRYRSSYKTPSSSSSPTLPTRLVPSCCVIFDLELLSLSFD
ncbi:hypothetical protein Tco_1518256, partial [Tanacetum coccineum]